jgi:hypothetical protein
MLVIVTIETKQLPVAAVERIVVVVVVFMVDGELAKSLAAEFSPTPRTNQGKELKRSLPIALLPFLSFVSCLGQDLIHLLSVYSGLLGRHGFRLLELRT